VSPLVAGLSLRSSDPGAGPGTLTALQSGILTFDLRVNDGVPPGTVIANQAVVDTVELPNLLTDGDGNPATGPEPTVVVVGNLQEVRITKAVSVVGGGPALAGATLEYVVQATNVGTVPAYAVVIRDDIAVPMPGYLTFVDQSWTLDGDDRHHRVGSPSRPTIRHLGALQSGRRRRVSAPCWIRTLALMRDERCTNPGDIPSASASVGARRHSGSGASTAASGTTRPPTTSSMRTSSARELGPASWALSRTPRARRRRHLPHERRRANYATTDPTPVPPPRRAGATALLGRAVMFTNDLQHHGHRRDVGLNLRT
jgi:uncharacterized repeat protein (TIGR01451 family)